MRRGLVRAGTAVAAALLLAGCGQDDKEEAPVGDVFGAGQPVCGFVDADLLREVLPDGEYRASAVGEPARREQGRPTAGTCRVETASGDWAVRVTVEHAEAPYADVLRSAEGRETFTFPPEEGRGRAGHRSAGSTAGWAVLERDDYVVAATVFTPAEGRDGAEAAAEIVRAVFRDLVDAG
jgi:hypothetical protein